MKKKLSAKEVEDFTKDAVNQQEQEDFEKDLAEQQKAIAWSEFEYEMHLLNKEDNN